jgi:Rieske Fe-S protein
MNRRRFLVVAGGACVACSSSSSSPDNGADASAGDGSAPPKDASTGPEAGLDAQSPPDSGTSCVTPGAGPVSGTCGVAKKQIRVPGAAKLAAGQALLVAANDVDGAIVARDAKGLYAMSAACTHQCCTIGICQSTSCVKGSILDAPCATPAPTALNATGSAFTCPCHGSEFAADGTVTHGPAARRLDAVKLTVDGADVIVDLSQPDDPATRVT